MNEPYRLRYTNQIVGAFLVIVLLFVIVLLAVLLRAGNFLADQQNYWIEASQNDIGDLRKGAEVVILGERAGTVTDIQYVAQGDRVRVDLGIDPSSTRRNLFRLVRPVGTKIRRRHTDFGYPTRNR